jgi:hypothetical protein
MVGFNIFVRAIPIISTGDLPAIEDDFFVFNAVDDLTIAQYSRDNVETNRNFTSGIGYVRGTDFRVIGTKSVGTGGFSVIYNGITYTPGDSFLTDNGTTWTFVGPAGAETTGAGRSFTLTKAGSVTKTVTLVVDRTAPTVSIAFSGMTFGVDTNNPMYRGEYIRYTPTYSDSISGVETGSFSYSTPSHFVAGPPSLTASGSPTAYVRTSATAPTSGTTNINVSVTDRAGNTGTATISAHFTVPPTAPTPTGTVTSTNQSPFTLFTGVELTESPTPYVNINVSSNVSIPSSMPLCRNSNNDDTAFRLQSGTLTINTAAVAGGNNTTRSLTAAVSANTSALSRNITPSITTQYHQTQNGTAFGNFDYNANKQTDINSEPTLVTPSGGLNAVAAETLYDRYVPTEINHRGIVSSQSNITIIGGQATTSSTTTNNQFIVRIPLLANNANNASYRISVRGPAGGLSSADVDVAYAPNGGTAFTPTTLNTTFTSAAGATSFDVRVTMKSTAVNSRVNAIYVEYIQ